MDIGRTVRRHRKLAGLTQSELARRIGTARVTIGRVERGDHVPRADTLLALLKASGVDVVLERWNERPELGPDAGTIGPLEDEMLRFLAARRVRCVVVGAVAERIRGSDVPVDGVQIVAVPDALNGRRMRRVRESAERRMRPSAKLRVLWGPPPPYASYAELGRDATAFRRGSDTMSVASADALIAIRRARWGPGDGDAAARLAAARRLAR